MSASCLECKKGGGLATINNLKDPEMSIPDVCQLLVDALFLQFPSSCISQICDELDETAHVGVVGARAAEEAGGGRRHFGDRLMVLWILGGKLPGDGYGMFEEMQSS